MTLTITADISHSAGVLPASGDLLAPFAAPCTVLVDSEQIRVRAAGPSSWLVDRGVNGTVAAAHSSGATVTPLVAVQGASQAIAAQPASVALDIAAGATNVCEVTITAKGAGGATAAGVQVLQWWLSDAETGAGLTGTSASGAVTTKAASGADLGATSAKKAGFIQTKADGTAILSITDTAKTGFYLCIRPVAVAAATVSRQLVAADYGA